MGDQFFDGGWCWMTHPDRNDGNAIPVKMEVVDGTRFYIPLDPTDETEFEWDRRDDEWEIVQGPDDILAFESRAELAEQALVEATEERDHLRAALAAHDDLVAALRDMLDWLDDGNRQLSESCAADVAKARAALSAAGATSEAARAADDAQTDQPKGGA